MTDNDSRLRLSTYLQLVRLPNVFTAMADVAMGVMFVGAQTGPLGGWILGCLMAASALLYVGGVVLNDVFDLAVDAQQRPERPIPSGGVSLRAAQRIGWFSLALGTALATATVLLVGQARPAIVGLLLAGCIVLYDAFLKPTPVGPPVMGACRMLNVLLGMSAGQTPLEAEHWLVAGGIGVYVAGVTWFARNEAGRSSRVHLALATVVMMLGITLLGWLPSWSANLVPLLVQQPQRWLLLMSVLGLLIGWRCVWAVLEPWPARVQMAVGQAVVSLIMLDAAACFAVRGLPAAMLILLLLIPTMLLRPFVRVT